MTKSVVVLDYGSGNVHSACRALERAGAVVELTSDRTKAMESSGLLVPGVGAFSAVMSKLRNVGAESLIDQRLAAGRPVMGICVGMQVLFQSGLEHGAEAQGLNQWPGVVEQLNAPTLPNIGWSKIEVGEDSKLFKGIEDEHFYFVHSYGVKRWELQVERPFIAPTLSWSQHGDRFLAAVENGPLVATQFHPEKSGKPGLKLLENWISSL